MLDAGTRSGWSLFVILQTCPCSTRTGPVRIQQKNGVEFCKKPYDSVENCLSWSKAHQTKTLYAYNAWCYRDLPATSRYYLAGRPYIVYLPLPLCIISFLSSHTTAISFSITPVLTLPFILLLTNLLSPLPRLPLQPLCPRFLLLQQLRQPLRRIKDPVRPTPTRRTARIFPVPFQRTSLAEIMTAACDDGGTRIGTPADNARKGDVFEESFFGCFGVFFFFFSSVFGFVTAVSAGDDGAMEVLFALGHVLPFLVELPPVCVVFASVEEFAVVAEAAEAGLFVAVLGIWLALGCS